MSNVIITGDVHIHDYRNYNLFDNPNFRIKQFEKLADRLVNIAQGTKAEALIIAGDYLHVATPRPYVVNAAFSFLDKVTEHMDVYLTHGQHDYDSRSLMGGEHTLLSLCGRVPRVRYLHREIATIGSRDFYFLGWEPRWSELLKEMPRCDVLIGHAQPRDVKIGQHGLYMYSGETIPMGDSAPFDLAFLGDIHFHQHRDKWIIPGTPIQHSFNDDPNVGVISLDTESMEWRRIPTIVPKHWEFLQLVVSDVESKNPFVVTRPTKSRISTDLQIDVDRRLDCMAVIQSEVEREKLKDIHKEVLGMVSKEVRTNVNLNFAIEKIQIQNFRSVADFEWENIDSGVNLIYGKNGMGKSSLVNAIMFALTGKSTQGSPRSLVQRGKKNMFVEVTLLYGRFRHTIRRGWESNGGTLRYSIDGVDTQAENQRVLSQKITENLPFLDFADFFYHEQDRPGFLASYNTTSRIDLISRVLGLKIVGELNDAALRKTVLLDRDIATLETKLASATELSNQDTLVDFSSMEAKVDEKYVKSLRELKESIRTLLEEERKAGERYRTKKAAIASSIKRETNSLAESESRRQAVEEERCYACGQSLSGEKHTEILEQIGVQIQETEDRLTSLREERENLSWDDENLKALETKLIGVETKIEESNGLKRYIENMERLKNIVDKAKKDAILIEDQLATKRAEKERLDRYRQITSSNGSIMNRLLTSVSDILTSDTIRVRAHKQLVSGEIRPDFNADMKGSHGWIPYDELSGGQRTVSDLIVLDRLIGLAGGVGLLIFDETFGDLDTENLELVVDLIKSIQCHNTFIISLAENFPYWDLAMQVRADAKGNTSYMMR